MFMIFGVCVIVLNLKLLGNQLGILSGFAMMGYLIFPLVAASIFNCVFHGLYFFLKAPVIIMALLLTMKISWDISKKICIENKFIMAFYPIALLEICLAFFIFYS